MSKSKAGNCKERMPMKLQFKMRFRDEGREDRATRIHHTRPGPFPSFLHYFSAWKGRRGIQKKMPRQPLLPMLLPMAVAFVLLGTFFIAPVACEDDCGFDFGDALLGIPAAMTPTPAEACMLCVTRGAAIPERFGRFYRHPARRWSRMIARGSDSAVPDHPVPLACEFSFTASKRSVREGSVNFSFCSNPPSHENSELSNPFTPEALVKATDQCKPYVLAAAKGGGAETGAGGPGGVGAPSPASGDAFALLAYVRYLRQKKLLLLRVQFRVQATLSVKSSGGKKIPSKLQGETERGFCPEAREALARLAALVTEGTTTRNGMNPTIKQAIFGKKHKPVREPSLQRQKITYAKWQVEAILLQLTTFFESVASCMGGENTAAGSDEVAVAARLLLFWETTTKDPGELADTIWKLAEGAQMATDLEADPDSCCFPGGGGGGGGGVSFRRWWKQLMCGHCVTDGGRASPPELSVNVRGASKPTRSASIHISREEIEIRDAHRVYYALILQAAAHTLYDLELLPEAKEMELRDIHSKLLDGK